MEPPYVGCYETHGELSKLFGCSPRPALDGRITPVAGGALHINDLAGRPAVVVTSSPVSGGVAWPDRNGELLPCGPVHPAGKEKMRNDCRQTQYARNRLSKLKKLGTAPFTADPFTAK